MLNQDKAILAIIVGLGSIVVGLTVKQFYASNRYSTQLGPLIARWQGRLLFVGIGIVFLSAGIGYFLSDH
jgi:hypothetical protein